MKTTLNIFLFYCQFTLAFSGILFAQENTSFEWINPSSVNKNILEGQAWPKEVNDFYDRLPARAKNKIPNDVWNNSTRSAGLMIRFRSNSKEIRIRYQTENGKKIMEHMPSTGISGVDLYAINSDGKEIWAAAERSFQDTIIYKYKRLNPNDYYHKLGREYRLYLPLYDKVEWLEIGIIKDSHFKPLKVREEKPIVVYGTSIAQGACASRPGMAWTSILGRKMDRPLINLGFSGSGRMEPSVVDLVNEINPKIFIIDCIPNLLVNNWKSANIKNEDELKERILTTVIKLLKTHPKTPILLVDHAGFNEKFISESRASEYIYSNKIQKSIFDNLISEGYKNLYYLSESEIGFQLDETVDGLHPNDLGMLTYANSYEKKLREILNEPIGSVSTMQPVSQLREPYNYDWLDKHNKILNINTSNPPKKIILANSIIHFWGGIPETNRKVERETWDNFLTPMGVKNYAYGWDRIENVLWRVYHGELDGFDAEKILVMIGTNNLHLNSDDEIIDGLHLLISGVKIRQPKAEIILMGILPRDKYEERLINLNLRIESMARELSVGYDYIGGVLVNENQKVDMSLFSDGLHPNKEGYLKLRNEIIRIIK